MTGWGLGSGFAGSWAGKGTYGVKKSHQLGRHYVGVRVHGS